MKSALNTYIYKHVYCMMRLLCFFHFTTVVSSSLPGLFSPSQVFKRHKGVDEDSSPLSEEAMDKSRVELAELERNFLERVAETTSKLKQGGGRGGGGSGGGSG